MITHRARRGELVTCKLDVTNLSAISADLGNVNAASGAVVLDNNGITLAAGTAIPNQVKWTNGAFIYGSGGYLGLNSPTYITLDTPGGSVGLTSGAFWPATAINLGLAGSRWGTVYAGYGNFSGDVDIDGDIRCTPSATSSGDTPVVYSEGNGIFYRKTNCATYSGSITGITVENGLVTDAW